MCGIFLYIQKLKEIEEKRKEEIKKSFQELKNRGPDNNKLIEKNKMIMGFHRLCIMDKSELGNQPFEYNNKSLICNGEIFNYKEIIEEFKFKCYSKSD